MLFPFYLNTNANGGSYLKMKNQRNIFGVLSPTIMAILLLLFAQLFARANIIMTPYLQAVTEKSICVMVESDSTDPITIEYGRTASYGSKATTNSMLSTNTKAETPTYVHRIYLTNLSSGRLYHYRATQDGKTFTKDASFVTAAPAGKPIRFAALADFRNNPTVHEAIAARIKSAKPMFSIYGGDICSNGSYEAFKKEFFLPNELSLSSCVPFFNVPGNHEGWSTNTKAFTQAPISPKYDQGYYSFDYGDVHFVAINNYVSYNENSAQWNFVNKDLSTSNKPWKIVFAHEPAYCAGGHNENKQMINMTIKLFEPNKVDLVIAGHSHFYQHNLVNGIHHLVLGSAGAPLYDPGNAPYVVKSAKVYHYAIIDVDKNKLHITVYKEDGSIIDTIEIEKKASVSSSHSQKLTYAGHFER